MSVYWSVGAGTIIDADMGEHIQRQIADRPRLSRNRPIKQIPEVFGRRLCWKSSSMASAAELAES
jgi:hypothetical protein